MKIILNRANVDQAIEEYLRNAGIVSPIKSIEFDISFFDKVVVTLNDVAQKTKISEEE